MTIFADWLRYYNDLDVEPFLEALTTMKNFYHEYGVAILKDAVSLLVVSLQLLLKAPTDTTNNPTSWLPKEGLRHAERCSRRRAKSRLHKVSRRWSLTHSLIPILQCTPLPKGCGLRRRRSISFDNGQAHALRTKSCSAL